MLAIAGGKGGCGKTTTTLLLAATLADRGGGPLAVDADASMPDLHLLAGAPAAPGLGAVRSGQSPAGVAHRSERFPGTAVLPSGDVPAADVGDALRRLEGQPEQVLLDCPAGSGPGAVRPLRVADRTLLVTTTSADSLRAASKTASMARAVGASPVGAVVVTRRPGGDDRRPDADRVAARLDCPVLGAVPRAEVAPVTAEEVRAAYARVAGKLHRRNI
ncbi:MAG: MinD/ParA family protein [Halorientalis sp.]